MTNAQEMGDFQTFKSLETFSYLPPLTPQEIDLQINYIISQGWTPSIEHELPSKAYNHYWTMWKLPFFGEKNPANVTAELDACRRAYPNHHIRLIGYDVYTQSQPVCFVAHQGR